MKREQERKRKSVEKKASGRKERSKRAGRLRVTGNTEMLDLDLVEEGLDASDMAPASPASEGQEGHHAGEAKQEGHHAGEAKQEGHHAGEAKQEGSHAGRAEPAAHHARTPEKSAKKASKTAVKNSAEDDSYLTFVPVKQNKAGHAADRNAAKSTGRNTAKNTGRNTMKSAGGNAMKNAGRHTGKASGRGTGGKIGAAAGRKRSGGPEFGFVDVMLALTGILVLIVGGIAFGVYRDAADAEDQVAAMAEVGEKMETIGIAGESILVAVADARIAAQELAAVADDTEENEYEEKELVSTVNVVLKLTSVQQDLKIKFTNKSTGKLIGNQAFAVKIEGPENLTAKDDDKDGIIYISSITPGEYTVTITAPDEIDNTAVAGISGLVTVKDQIEYKKIDVTDEVKSESEINVAQEDTAVATAVESTLTDTVEWVESTKTELTGDGSITWEQVSKSDIPDPSSTALLDRILTTDGANGSFLQNVVKLEQSASLSGLSVIKTLQKGVYYTEETETGTEIETEKETETGTGTTALSVTGVTITGDSTCTAGSSLTLHAETTTSGTGSLSDGDYSWSGASGSGSSATFSADVAGSYDVSVTVKGVTATKTITVKEAASATVSGISVSAGASGAEVGKSVTITASVSMSDGSSYGGTISWSVSAGQLSGSGTSVTVTSDTAQTVKVTAKAGDQESSASVEFYTANISVTKITISSAASVTVGGTTTLSLDVQPSDATNKSVTWKVTSGTDVVSVDSSGVVTGLKAGTATVTAVSQDGSSITGNTCTVTVTSASVKITLKPSTLTMKVGETETIEATVTTTGNTAVTWKAGDTSIVKITESGDDSCTIQALKVGETTLTATSSENSSTAQLTVTVELADGTALLKDKNGNQLYYKSGDEYIEATVADYYKYDVFYRKKDTTQYFYTGWQTIDGARYYYDKNGVPVTGDQVIQGVKYTFNSDGSLQVTGGMGIDISKHNGTIDWSAVKEAGVDYVILRCGYRGSSTGVLVEDEKFKTNIQGALAAGLKVGIYFFSQAVNEVEAVEEASLTLSLIRNYQITYPVYIDVEAANGRADSMDAATRTKVITAFCETIRNSGYTAGVYANKTWLSSKMNVSSLSSYKIWLAQYATTPTYSGRYEMWQYSSTGTIAGISGNVDLNISYMSY